MLVFCVLIILTEGAVEEIWKRAMMLSVSSFSLPDFPSWKNKALCLRFRNQLIWCLSILRKQFCTGDVYCCIFGTTAILRQAFFKSSGNKKSQELHLSVTFSWILQNEFIFIKNFPTGNNLGMKEQFHMKLDSFIIYKCSNKRNYRVIC